MAKHELPHPFEMRLGTVFWVWWARTGEGGFHRVSEVSSMGAARSEPVI